MIREQREGAGGRVLVLTIDRPASRNALDGTTIRELSARFGALPDDVRAVVLTGASGTFVSGGDLRELSEVSDRASTEAFCDLGRQMCDAIEDARVPVLAAVEGFALGGGAELACACDLRVVAGDATLGFFQAKMAVTTAWGTFARLVAYVGVGRATDLLYRAHALSGLEARALGLVEHVTAAPGVPFLTCGFFTDGYAAEAAQLRESLDRTGTPYFLKRFASRGYSEATTRIKPEFLLDWLRRFPGRDIVYLDTDSVVRSPLKLFFDFDADLGVFVAPADAGMTHRYLTGTLYLRNTPAVQAFVEDWVGAQGGMLLGVDQDSFTAAIERHPALRIGALPESYVKIFDRGAEAPVVEHFQASRQRVKLQRAMNKTRNAAIGLAVLVGLAWLASRFF